MGIVVAQAHGGKDLKVTVARIVATTEVWVASTQVHISWMDLMCQTGGEKMGAEILNILMKTKMPGLKNPESLARSRRENTLT